MNKALFFSFLLLGIFARSQDAYFVNDGNFEKMTATLDSCYLGSTNGQDLVKTDSLFTALWGLEGFSDIQDLTIDEYGNYLVLDKINDSIVAFKIDDSGVVINQKAIQFGSIVSAQVKADSNSYYFVLSGGTTSATLTIMKSDTSFANEWVKEIVNPSDELTFYKASFELHNDTVTVLSNNSAWEESTITHFFQLNEGGDFVWSKIIGHDCSHYANFIRLSDGKFVLVGTIGDGYNHALVTVTDFSGNILSTKTRDYVGHDFGGNSLRIKRLSDDRYVLSNTHSNGPGLGAGKSLTLFDNHKPVELWTYDPVDFESSDGNFYVRCIDWNDRIVFAGHTYSNSLPQFEYTFGRYKWANESCGIGNSYPVSFNYLLDTCVDYALQAISLSHIWEQTHFFHPPTTYTNTFYCSSSSTDPGSTVSGNHLYGSDMSTPCEALNYSDPVEDTTSSSAGVFVDDESLYKVYPNPTNELLTIQYPDIIQIEIINSMGQVVFEKDQNDSKINLDVSTLKTGLYVLKIRSKTAAVAFVKFLKE